MSAEHLATNEGIEQFIVEIVRREDLMSFSVEIKKEQAQITLYVEGVLDISTVPLFDSYLENLEDINLLTIDFSRLKFIDSTGLGAIMNVIYLSQEKGFKLRLQGMDEQTDHIFQTVGLYEILKTFQGDVI
ncbi:STAS domain-containing protein [Bacillus alveayuensis]|uniref:STAS domain-containing protein n=1 Tax=Aeribacillus alveayuensis TaxID=279215 RepID=UPI001F289B42|nr:STAS domain-containing protein [Bacillus alveayuensis]